MDRLGRVSFTEWSWDESGQPAGKVDYHFETDAAVGA
jgi:hypothetical protein